MPSTLYQLSLCQICFLLTHRRLLCSQDILHAKFALACLQYRSVQEQCRSFVSQSYLVISKWTHCEPHRLPYKSFQELDGQYLGFSASGDWTCEMNLSMGGSNSLVWRFYSMASDFYQYFSRTICHDDLQSFSWVLAVHFYHSHVLSPSLLESACYSYFLLQLQKHSLQHLCHRLPACFHSSGFNGQNRHLRGTWLSFDESSTLNLQREVSRVTFYFIIFTKRMNTTLK